MIVVAVDDNMEAINNFDDTKVFKVVRNYLADGSKTFIFSICLSDATNTNIGM